MRAACADFSGWQWCGIDVRSDLQTGLSRTDIFLRRFRAMVQRCDHGTLTIGAAESGGARAAKVTGVRIRFGAGGQYGVAAMISCEQKVVTPALSIVKILVHGAVETAETFCFIGYGMGMDNIHQYGQTG